MEHKIKMQDRVSMHITWTDAQYTLLWFMNGIRPNSKDSCDVYINGVPFSESHAYTRYYYLARKRK